MATIYNNIHYQTCSKLNIKLTIQQFLIRFQVADLS